MSTMTNTLAVVGTYVLLALPVIAHLSVDLHKRYSGHPIRHWVSALIAVVSCAICGLVNMIVAEQAWWQFMVYGLAVHFAFFDLTWNWANNHKWYYNGDPSNPERALTDKMWDYVPIYAQPLVRLWVLGVGYGVYYHLDWIIG